MRENSTTVHKYEISSKIFYIENIYTHIHNFISPFPIVDWKQEVIALVISMFLIMRLLNPVMSNRAHEMNK